MIERMPAAGFQPGDELGNWTYWPVTRHQLALYCGGSGDHNPIHVDSDFARSVGLPDVIAHGMLVMAFAGRALGELFPLQAMRQFKLRFVAPSHVGDVLSVQARVLACESMDDGTQLRVELTVRAQDLKSRAVGEARVILD